MNPARLKSIERHDCGCCYCGAFGVGPGLLESAYEACLYYELRKRGLQVESQVPLPVVYEEIKLEAGYRIDILVENSVVLELKAVEAIAPVHRVQLLSYLRLSHKPLGLLLNFHVALMKDGILRMKNGYQAVELPAPLPLPTRMMQERITESTEGKERTQSRGCGS